MFAKIFFFLFGSVLSVLLFLPNSSIIAQEPSRSQRPSGAIVLPPEIQSIIELTRDVRIVTIVRQAFYLEQQEDFAAAIEKYKELLALDTLGKATAPTLNTIAGCYGKLGSFSEEISWAKKAIAAEPGFAPSYINLGNGYLALGNLDNAEGSYSKVAEIKPDDPLGHYHLGLVAERMQNWQKAEKFYRRSIEVDPKFVDGHFNLAVSYANQGKQELATRELEQVLTLDPLASDARAMLNELRQLKQP
jgi:tetratricopeptide (TPR) repeat protein